MRSLGPKRPIACRVMLLGVERSLPCIWPMLAVASWLCQAVLCMLQVVVGLSIERRVLCRLPPVMGLSVERRRLSWQPITIVICSLWPIRPGMPPADILYRCQPPMRACEYTQSKACEHCSFRNNGAGTIRSSDMGVQGMVKII